MPEPSAGPRFPDLAELVQGTPGLAGALGAVVERWERAGRLPGKLTLEANTEVAEALRRVFSARTVRVASAGRVRLDLATFLRSSGRTEADLETWLYAVLRRQPRNPAVDARALRTELERGLAELGREARTSGSRSFVSAELSVLGTHSSELVEQATRDGLARALEVALGVVRSIDALEGVRDPIRLQNFSARVLGSSKALRPGGDLFRRLGAALVAHHAPTRRALDEQGVPPNPATEIARALEVHGIYQDETAASVLCFGPLVYRKRGAVFDQVARHSALGESSRLITHQLRDAAFDRPEVRRVTLFENLTPYLDYVDECALRRIEDEIVLCSGGQATWAVIAVLRGLARYGLPVRHSGDLDRSGVLILRNLRRRSGARVEPLFMDIATHARFRERGLRLSPEERQRLRKLLDAESAEEPCHELLCAVRDTGIWIEQEQFTDELLAGALE